MTNKEIEIAKLKYVINNLEVYKKNQEVITMYDDYINNIVELFDFIKTKNNNKEESDLFYTMVFTILIEMGFFSADRNFKSNEIKSEVTINPGMNIVIGHGVCRNIACFYEDVFSYFYNYPLKMCCFDAKGIIDNDTNRYGNHVINLTRYHDIIYGFDVLNKCIFKAKGNDLFEGLDIDYNLSYKPNGDLLLELLTCLNPSSTFLEEVSLKRHLFQIASKNDILSMNEYKKLIKLANDFIIERKQLLQSFMLENEELTHEIKKKMLLLK